MLLTELTFAPATYRAILSQVDRWIVDREHDKILHESRQKTVRLLTDYREAYDEHYLIYQGIKAGDPSAARNAMVSNLLKVEKRFRQAVGKVAEGPGSKAPGASTSTG